MTTGPSAEPPTAPWWRWRWWWGWRRHWKGRQQSRRLHPLPSELCRSSMTGSTPMMLTARWWCSRGWWVRRVSPGGLNLPPSSSFNGRRPHVFLVPSLHYHLISTLVPIIFSIFALILTLQPFTFTLFFATWLFPSFIRFNIVNVNNQHFAVPHNPNGTFSYLLYDLKGTCPP